MATDDENKTVSRDGNKIGFILRYPIRVEPSPLSPAWFCVMDAGDRSICMTLSRPMALRIAASLNYCREILDQPGGSDG